MARSLDRVIAELPAERRKRIEARYQELRQEVESLRQLREIAGKAQAEVAATLNIRQPSVSKIERQTDMYLSTLRNYVEAIGGRLELTISLPQRPPLKIRQLADVGERVSERASVVARRKREVTGAR